MSDLGRHGRNFSWLLLAEFVQKALSLVLFMYLSRKLSVEGNSAYGVFAAIFPFFVTVTNMGFYDIAVRDIAQDRSRAKTLVMTAMAGQYLVFIPCFMVLWFVLDGSSYSTLLKQVILLAFIGALLHTMTRNHYAVLAAHEHFKGLSWLNMWLRLVVVAGSFLILYWGGGVVALVAYYVPVYVLQVIVSRWAASQLDSTKTWRIDTGTLRYLFAQGFPIALGGIVATLYFALDLLLLEAFGFNHTAGFYAIGVRFLLLMLTFSDLVAALLYPVFSRKAIESPQAAQSALEIGVKAAMLFALPSAIGVSLLTNDIVRLIAGASNLPSAPAVAGLTWVFLFEMVNRNFIDFLRASGKQTFPTMVYGAALALKSILVFVFLRHSGSPVQVLLAINVSLGAAMTIAFLVITPRVIRGISVLNIIDRSALRPLFASIVMGGALWFAADLPLYASMPIGMTVFGLTALLSGAIGRFEKDLVRKTIGI